MDRRRRGAQRPNVLTIDLEDWFHSLEPDPSRWSGFERRATAATDRLLELLDEAGVFATFFVLGDVAVVEPDIVRRVAAAGHEVGSHGVEHRFVYDQSPQDFRAEVRHSLSVLGDLTGEPIVSYRAPYFSITAQSLWALDVLAEEGIRHDSSIFPVRNHRYGIPGWDERRPHEIRPGMVEWPIACVPSPLGNLPCCGGVYLRVLPWPLTAWALQALEWRDDPVVAYLHPWELDHNQPRIATQSRFLGLRHYWGLSAMGERVRRLLAHASFTSINRAAAAL